MQFAKNSCKTGTLISPVVIVVVYVSILGILIKLFLYTTILIRPDVISAEKFESLVNFKCLRALANPGESVGLLAAQVGNY